MSDSPRSAPRAVTPYLVYEDAPAAIRFLVEAFGFRERMSFPMPDGRIGHAELEGADGSGATLMLASVWRDAGMASPRELPAVHMQVHCTVDDVDAHYARALAAGATVVGPPMTEHGSRAYRAVDCEGHRWIFASPDGEESAS